MHGARHRGVFIIICNRIITATKMKHYCLCSSEVGRMGGVSVCGSAGCLLISVIIAFICSVSVHASLSVCLSVCT